MDNQFTILFTLLGLIIFEVIQYVVNYLKQKKVDIEKSDVILIAGACGSVGTALVNHLQPYGCSFILIDRNKQELRKLKEFLTNAGCKKVFTLAEDLRNYTPITSFLQTIIDTNIIPTYIILNAAVKGESKVTKLSAVDYNQVVETNVSGFVNIIHTLMPMIAKKGAHIVVMSSILSFLYIPLLSAYSSSKSALAAYISSIEMEHPKVTYTIVYPTKIKGPLFNTFVYKNVPSFIVDELDPGYVAKTIIKGVAQRRQSIYIPCWIALLNFLPRGLATRLSLHVHDLNNDLS